MRTRSPSATKPGGGAFLWHLALGFCASCAMDAADVVGKWPDEAVRANLRSEAGRWREEDAMERAEREARALGLLG